MSFDDLKSHLDRLFAPRPGASSRDQAPLLREALVEFKIGIGQLREALEKSERELDAARREAADYERRGRLAAEIGDAETSGIAEEFTRKAAERVDLLERKVLVQRDELLMAEREYEITRERYQAAARGVPYDPAPSSVPPGSGTEADLGDGMSPHDQMMLDHRAREAAKAAAVEAQLAHLKKKLGERS